MNTSDHLEAYNKYLASPEYQLDIRTCELMGLPKHTSGEEWPQLPFYGYDGPRGPSPVGIRWNDKDVAYVYHTEPKGRLDKEETESWYPTYKIRQAMMLWQEYPPKTWFLRLEIGTDGFTVRAHQSHQSAKDAPIFDDYVYTLPHAITLAWIYAMEHDTHD